MSLHLIGYVRVSSPGQLHNTSFDTQAAAIRGICERCGYELVAVRQEQETASGRKTRCVFQSVLSDISAGTADGLAVYSLDRFARSALQGLKVAKWLHDHQKQLVVVDVSLDTTTPLGKFMLTSLLAVAELERSMIIQRITEGKKRVKMFRTALAISPPMIVGTTALANRS